MRIVERIKKKSVSTENEIQEPCHCLLSL